MVSDGAHERAGQERDEHRGRHGATEVQPQDAGELDVGELLLHILRTSQIDLDIHGFDAAGPAGNLNAIRHFDMPNDLRNEIIYARLWAGLHYHFSSVAGVVLGRNVAKYNLTHAFQPLN